MLNLEYDGKNIFQIAEQIQEFTDDIIYLKDGTIIIYHNEHIFDIEEIVLNNEIFYRTYSADNIPMLFFKHPHGEIVEKPIEKPIEEIPEDLIEDLIEDLMEDLMEIDLSPKTEYLIFETDSSEKSMSEDVKYIRTNDYGNDWESSVSDEVGLIFHLSSFSE